MENVENNKMPLVSVAIITYNQKNYLRECIESVLEQDYPNLEIVVADDGSTDGTQDLLHAYAQQHPNLFVLRLAEKNQGITANSNAAHFACSGKYIAWMGGDDLMLPGKITKQVEILESNPDYAFCYHDLDVFDSDSNRTLYLYSQKKKPIAEGGIRDLFKHGSLNGACSTLVRAECVPHGYDSRLRVASDWHYWLTALSTGKKFVYLTDVLGRYRRHEHNISRLSKSSTPLAGIQDHLMTIDLIGTQMPFLYKFAGHRRAELYRGLRYLQGGKYYRQLLLLSLRAHFNLKSLALYALSVLGKEK